MSENLGSIPIPDHGDSYESRGFRTCSKVDPLAHPKKTQTLKDEGTTHPGRRLPELRKPKIIDIGFPFWLQKVIDAEDPDSEVPGE